MIARTHLPSGGDLSLRLATVINVSFEILPPSGNATVASWGSSRERAELPA